MGPHKDAVRPDGHRDRFLELAPKLWFRTRARLDPAELTGAGQSAGFMPLLSAASPAPIAAHARAHTTKRPLRTEREGSPLGPDRMTPP